jgi:hypothetical protein
MIRPNKDDRKGNLSKMQELSSQLEISQEIARIALQCPTCRDMVRNIIIRIRKNKELSDSSSQEVSQTQSEFVNLNNNAVGIADSDSHRIARNGADVIDSSYTHQYK